MQQEVKSKEGQNALEDTSHRVNFSTVRILLLKTNDIVQVDNKGDLPSEERKEVSFQSVFESQRIFEINEILDNLALKDLEIFAFSKSLEELSTFFFLVVMNFRNIHEVYFDFSFYFLFRVKDMLIKLILFNEVSRSTFST